jgi:hypothetical protein
MSTESGTVTEGTEGSGSVPARAAMRPEDVPAEWVKAAEDHYSMHGAGLIRNILAGVAPLIHEHALLAFAAELDAKVRREERDPQWSAYAHTATLARERASLLPSDANGSGDGPSAAPRSADRTEALRAAQPPGEFARVELPGYVAWTGWVTEETFAGAGVLVVRDGDGAVQARVSASAFRQVIPLPLPKPGSYDGQLALTAGDDGAGDDCTCQDDYPDGIPDPGCPEHGHPF